MEIVAIVFALLMVVWLVLIVRPAPAIAPLGLVSWTAVLILGLKVFGVLH